MANLTESVKTYLRSFELPTLENPKVQSHPDLTLSPAMEKVYTSEDVAKHNTKTDLWVSIHGKVYNLTSYSEDHPGGVDSLKEVAGTDATTAFEDLGHSGDAREKMERFCVGKLDHDEDSAPKRIERQLTPVVDDPPTHAFTAPHVRMLVDVMSTSMIVAVAFAGMRRFGRFTTSHHWSVPGTVVDLLPWAVSTSLTTLFVRRTLRRLFPPHTPTPRPAHFKVTSKVAVQKTPNHAVLDPRAYLELPITSVEKLSQNSNKIIVDLPNPKAVLGLPVGQHIAIRAMVNDAPVSRSYTPTSSNKDLGRLELVIKNYDDGLLTGNYLKGVKVGDKLSISGPRGQMRYRRGLANNIGMIAGGTGITPMYQLIRAICEDPRDDTKVALLYANQTQEDILLKAELDNFAAEHADQFEVRYLLSKPKSGWTGGVGRVTQELVEEAFAPAGDKQNKVMVCGPPGMVNSAKEWLVRLGYERANAVSKMADQVFVF